MNSPGLSISGQSVLVFTALAGIMPMTAFVALIVPIVRTLGLAEWHAGLSVTASGLLWMLSARGWGALGDRIGRRRVLLIVLSAYALVYVVMALFVDQALRDPPAVLVSVAVLVATRGLIGLFYAGILPTATAIIADLVPAGQRASYMAQLGAANALGMVVGPAVGGWIAYGGLALSLYVAAALPLLSLLTVWWLLPASAAVAVERSGGRRLSLSWSDERLLLSLLTSLVVTAAISIAQMVAGFFAFDRLQLSAAEGARVTGLVLAALGVGIGLAQALVMNLRKVLPVRWIMLGSLVSTIGFALVPLVQNQWQLLAAHVLAAFGMGLLFPSFQALTADSVEAHEQGAAAGTVAAAQGLGMVVGPLIGTLLYRWSPNAPYLLITLVLAALLLVASMRQQR
ncbi:MFS transporter [Pseudomonas piscis]|uniref:MFS transporter n=1 Tax=Pseudomonas piscis TaxID=2614538 RepID=UPI00384D539A